MKDLNTFTASVYAKAAHKRKQNKQTALVLAVAIFATASAVTAVAARPQLQRLGTEVGVTATSSADLQTLQSMQNLLTAPSDPDTAGRTAGSEETRLQKPAGTTAQEAANRTVPATAAQAGEPGAESGNAATTATRTAEKTEILTMTEIAWEGGLQPVDGTPTVTRNMLLHKEDIVAAAYNALDPATRSAADPAEAFVVTTHDARENTDGFAVYFNTDAETIIVRLDKKLNPLGITRRAAETATVSGAYNPNN
ncbi:MAG: hypothetical protein IK080_10560 [Clostridia bacterium]|nr:hypothetical protein [Clostridia bacterium]